MLTIQIKGLIASGKKKQLNMDDFRAKNKKDFDAIEGSMFYTPFT
jgi:hypothetical protein